MTARTGPPPPRKMGEQPEPRAPWLDAQKPQPRDRPHMGHRGEPTGAQEPDCPRGGPLGPARKQGETECRRGSRRLRPGAASAQQHTETQQVPAAPAARGADGHHVASCLPPTPPGWAFWRRGASDIGLCQTVKYFWETDRASAPRPRAARQTRPPRGSAAKRRPPAGGGRSSCLPAHEDSCPPAALGAPGALSAGAGDIL